MSILVLSNAGRQEDHGQLSYVAGLVVSNFEKGSIFHTLSCTSCKSKLPVKSIRSAEMFATGEAIDERKVLVQVMSTLLGTNLDLIIALDTKDLYNSLSTQRNALDKFIRPDVNFIRYKFETGRATE